MDGQRFFSVTCKCGHTGSRHTYIPVAFAVMARNGKEAAAAARWIPRCKHHHKDCILEVAELSMSEYQRLLAQNEQDPYLHFHSIQEQGDSIADRVLPETNGPEDWETRKREPSRRRVFRGKDQMKNPHIYLRNNPDIDQEEML